MSRCTQCGYDLIYCAWLIGPGRNRAMPADWNGMIAVADIRKLVAEVKTLRAQLFAAERERTEANEHFQGLCEALDYSQNELAEARALLLATQDCRDPLDPCRACLKCLLGMWENEVRRREELGAHLAERPLDRCTLRVTAGDESDPVRPTVEGSA